MKTSSMLPHDCQLEKEDLSILEDDDMFSYLLFSDTPKREINAENKHFLKCKFSKIDFSNVKIDGARFDNCIFDNCTIQNVNLSKNGIYYCIFEKCKLIGIKVNNSKLKDVTFDNTEGMYNDFSFSSLVNVHFIDSVLSYTNFEGINTKDVIFSHCNIKNSVFLESNIRDVDFSSTDISDIKIDAKSLKGLIVSRDQAIALSRFLGIFIKEEL